MIGSAFASALALVLAQRPALPPVLRVGGGVLIGDLALREALQAQRQAAPRSS